MQYLYGKFKASDRRIGLIKADDSVRGFVFKEKTVLHTEESKIKTEDEEVVLLWQDAIHKNHLKYLR